ncbi:chymotrypsin inhibitor Ani s 6-like [Athalia rosae]|uniref:chymotrypsin inhibitor Ani s 6-like n=1 Tax=Athalia rosae TaxID=37344 RepID=UPI00203447FB|nr:chymotrypsin inhibitor Ani s 6-like [Athalia rosae]
MLKTRTIRDNALNSFEFYNYEINKRVPGYSWPRLVLLKYQMQLPWFGTISGDTKISNMLRFTLTVFLLISLTYAAVPAGGRPPRCAPGEIYSECAPCDKSCDNLDPACTKQCRIGCYCREGYVRNYNKQCIPQYMC